MTAGKLALLLAGASFAAIALAEKSRKQVILDEAQDALDALPRGYTADQLAAEGIHARVVSVPATTVFDKQDSAYKASVLPAGVPRIAVEAGVTDFWWKYQVQAVVGIDTFGESAPAGVLFKHFGFTVENVVNTAKSVIA